MHFGFGLHTHSQLQSLEVKLYDNQIFESGLLCCFDFHIIYIFMLHSTEKEGHLRSSWIFHWHIYSADALITLTDQSMQ